MIMSPEGERSSVLVAKSKLRRGARFQDDQRLHDGLAAP